MSEELTWHNETRKLSELIPWDRNARQIREEDAERLVESLEEFGQVETLAIEPDGGLIDGHQRKYCWSAAAQYGPDYEVDVRVASRPLTEYEKQKLSVFLHKGAHGEWNWDGLANWGVEEDLFDWGFEPEELGLDGWDDEEPPEDPGAQVDRAEELREEWGVESGQLWRLGDHRLICGDCTDGDVVARVMDGGKADLVLTDPPYGVEYVGKTEDALTIQNDGADDLLGLLQDSLGLAYDVSRDGACWYIAAPPGPQFYDFATVLLHFDVWRQTLVWVKNAMVLGHSDYHYKHEALFYGWKPGASHHSPPDRAQTTTWEFDKPSASREHPIMKPIGIYEKAVRNSTDAGGIIYDPFLGSGTTLIACERLGRKCRAVEIEPKYVAVALDRWATMTGREPELVT